MAKFAFPLKICRNVTTVTSQDFKIFKTKTCRSMSSPELPLLPDSLCWQNSSLSISTQANLSQLSRWRQLSRDLQNKFLSISIDDICQDVLFLFKFPTCLDVKFWHIMNFSNMMNRTSEKMLTNFSKKNFHKTFLRCKTFIYKGKEKILDVKAIQRTTTWSTNGPKADSGPGSVDVHSILNIAQI